MKGALAEFRRLDDGAHRAEFYRMWAAGFGAGFPHPKILETMGKRRSEPSEEVRAWLLAATKRGRSVTEAVKAGGRRFEDFEVALLTLGDESGSLDRSLRLLGDFYMNKQKTMNWVKNKMAYPFFTGIAACFIAPFPLLFFGHTLAYVLAAGGAVSFLLVSSGGIVAAAAASYGRQPALARARMARALTTAVEAGLALPRALRLAASASANPDIQAHVRRFSEHQLATASIGDTLAGCPHLTPEFVAIVATSEKTGDFSGLAKLADLYEDGFR